MDINKIRNIILSGTIEHVKFILENYDFNINEKDINGDTILNALIKDLKYMKWLNSDNNYKIEFRDKFQLLLSHPNIDVNISNGKENPVSLLARKLDNVLYVEVFKTLLNHKSFDVNYSICNNKRRILDYIIEYDNNYFFDYLLNMENIDINYTLCNYIKWSCPLMMALERHNIYMLNKLFFNKNIDLSILDNIQTTSVLEHIYRQSVNFIYSDETSSHYKKIFKRLITTNKININKQCSRTGYTILHFLISDLLQKLNTRNPKVYKNDCMNIFEYIDIILKREDYNFYLKDNNNNTIIDYLLKEENKNEKILEIFSKYIPLNPILMYV